MVSFGPGFLICCFFLFLPLLVLLVFRLLDLVRFHLFVEAFLGKLLQLLLFRSLKSVLALLLEPLHLGIELGL
jgi:hypothetical protein